MGSIMSSTINASTASGGGLIQTADASGILALQTAGVTALSIDASQNVTVATQAVNNSTTKVATTAFANPASSLAANGYVKLPSGVIIQWGVTSIANASLTGVAITLPIAFPAAIVHVSQTAHTPTGRAATAEANNTIVALSTTSITIASGQTTTPANIYWIAIGY